MANQNIAAWLVEVRGNKYDLEDLSLYLDGSPVTVIKREKRHFLYIHSAIAGQTGEHVYPLAIEYAALLNGAGMLHIADYRPIALKGTSPQGIDEAEHVITTYVAPPNPPESWMRSYASSALRGAMVPLMHEAISNTAKADALAIVGRQLPSWSELYLVFELVEADVGKRMYSEGWLTRSDTNRFARTANSYTALGKAARHGRDRGDPLKTPMSQQEALVMIRQLVNRWLSDA